MPKPFITYQQQIALLKSKHLTVPDEKEAERILADIGYFTLIGGYNQSDMSVDGSTVTIRLEV